MAGGGREAARSRRTDPGSLSRGLRGELDWIVMKALEKDRMRRYGSMDQLADDLRRYLSGRPVEARRPTMSYRAWKLVQRNRLLVSASVVVVLLVGAISTFYTIRLAREHRVAQVEAARANRVVELLKDLFRVSEPGGARGREITARELLDRAAVDIEQGLADEPEVQAEMWDIIGDIYRQLSLFDESEPLLERALRLREEQLDPQDLRITSTLLHLGQLRFEQWRYDEAVASLERALELLDRDRSPDTTVLVDVLIQHAAALNELSRTDEAQAAVDRALQTLDDSVAEKDRRKAQALSVSGYIDWTLGNDAEAGDHFREALELNRRTLGEEHWKTAESHYDLATSIHVQGNLDEARPFYERALAIYEASLGAEHTHLSDVLNAWAVLEKQAGDNGAAERMYLRSAEINRLALGPNNEGSATALTNLSKLYAAQDRLSEAEEAAARALAIYEELGARSDIAFGLIGLAEIYTASGRMAEAEPLYLRGIEIRRELLDPGHARVGTALLSLGEHYRSWERYAEAEPLLRESLDILVTALGDDHALVAINRDRLARVAAGLGDCARALELAASAGAIEDPPEDDAAMKRCRQDP
jgi:tetratricopeptide (TPR) repeat protein